VGVDVGVGVGVNVAVAVAVGVGVNVAVAVALGVGLGVGVKVAVAVGVGDGAAETKICPSIPWAWSKLSPYLYLPAIVTVIWNRGWLTSIGFFHRLAPGGMFHDVVVCIPFTHVQVMVSPGIACTVLGVNTKSDTVT
jgi:hypothetical protein